MSPATDCRGKIRYATQKAASEARNAFVRRRGVVDQINIFACQACGGYHIGRPRRYITSRPKRGGDRVRSKLRRYLELAAE